MPAISALVIGLKPGAKLSIQGDTMTASPRTTVIASSHVLGSNAAVPANTTIAAPNTAVVHVAAGALEKPKTQGEMSTHSPKTTFIPFCQRFMGFTSFAEGCNTDRANAETAILGYERPIQEDPASSLEPLRPARHIEWRNTNLPPISGTSLP
jgi:hypothetical protein